tara:strand:- start:946 stop:1824 length:879 start_codon:yes stop_codon:yes gene_type:complete
MAESMQQTEEIEEVEIELKEPESEEEKEVNVVETEKAEKTEEKSSDKEVEDFSENVKKRINKLTYKIREAERREKAAIEYAQNVQKELNKTNENLSIKDKSLYDEYSARVESQLGVAENKYKQALDLSDTDAILDSQKDIAKLAVELESLKRVRPEKEAKVEEPQQQQQPPLQQTAPAPDPKAQEWAKKNDWFGTDLAMTTSAFAFHRQLVEAEGFDPTSDDYYKEVDKRMEESFPHKLGKTPQNVQDNVVVSSPGTRGRTGKGRVVKLTPSQVSIAKRLGVPLEEYAKHVK